MEFKMNSFIVFHIYRLDTNAILKNDDSQLYNYFHAYSFDKLVNLVKVDSPSGAEDVRKFV